MARPELVFPSSATAAVRPKLLFPSTATYGRDHLLQGPDADGLRGPRATALPSGVPVVDGNLVCDSCVFRSVFARFSESLATFLLFFSPFRLEGRSAQVRGEDWLKS